MVVQQAIRMSLLQPLISKTSRGSTVRFIQNCWLETRRYISFTETMNVNKRVNVNESVKQSMCESVRYFRRWGKWCLLSEIVNELIILWVNQWAIWPLYEQMLRMKSCSVTVGISELQSWIGFFTIPGSGIIRKNNLFTFHSKLRSL